MSVDQKSEPSRFNAYVYNERTSSLAGPISGQDITAVAIKDNSAEVFCVTQDLKIKKTDLLELNNPSFPPFNDPFTVDTVTETGVVASKKGDGFLYRNLYRSGPFTDPSTVSQTITDPLYFDNSYLAISETNWIHLGNEHGEKQVYRVDLAFHKNSCGHLWLFVKNDEGQISGQYKGMIKEHVKVFTNLRGRRFKVQMIIATHNDYPWAMREMSIGHLLGKSF